MSSDTLLPRLEETSPENPSVAAAAEPKPIIKPAIIFFFFYLTFGVLIYSSLRDQFSGITTNLFIDALYFSVVTLSTVGYGDIVPLTLKTKILTVVLVVLGVGFLDFLLNRVLNRFLDLQENAILSCIITRTRSSNAIRNHVLEDGRISIEWKLVFAFCAVGFCVGIGVLFLCVCEGFEFWDSVYLSVISVTTVGYGDKTFKTGLGRFFAAVWLLVSTMAMGSWFYYFAETRIDRTVKKLPRSKSEFIVWKLKETKRITEDEIKKILSEFEKSLEGENENIEM